MTNLALNKPATQSSTSKWSSSPLREEDAAGANNGKISGDMGFHTSTELHPWWQVDLQGEFVLEKIVIFNRRHAASRLRYFSILGSLDGKGWHVIHRKTDETIFGQDDDSPYVAEIGADHLARLVRIRLDGIDCLHFCECQVFGDIPDSYTRERLLNRYLASKLRRNEVPKGRNGTLVSLDDFMVFVDSDHYDDDIAKALKGGTYEGRERLLVKALVRPNDRVIEAGTAIGVVAMTAASIVGAENVVTFDANPGIVADARSNFDRNELSSIKSNVGVLKNRSSFDEANKFVEFYVSRAFWASRLTASMDDHDIITKIDVPIFSLEDEIAAHRATILICDIEGGEAELLTEADLSNIRMVIMETHYWSVGEIAINEMIRRIMGQGFSLHLGHSANQVVVLYR